MKIMIVDDSKVMRTILVRAMKGAGFEACTFAEASNGAEALESIRTATPDLVVADWNMPQMNGLELLRALRSEGKTMKFGFVTSESSSDVRDLALGEGAAFLVTKPFTPEVLKTALAAVAP
jgi:two-component system chemotaxis response regulator CheY